MEKDEKWFEKQLFQQWFFDNWIAAGGLVTKKTAADLYHVTQARITHLIAAGKLKLHKYQGFEFLELPEIKKMVHQKIYTKLAEEYKKVAEGLPEGQREDFLKAQMEIIDTQLHSIEPVKKAACNAASITERARPRTRKNAGTPRTPEGKRGKGRKKL